MTYVRRCGSELHHFTQQVTLYSYRYVRFIGLPGHHHLALSRKQYCSQAVPHVSFSCLFSEPQYSINSFDGWRKTCSICSSKLISLNETTQQLSAGNVRETGCHRLPRMPTSMSSEHASFFHSDITAKITRGRVVVTDV